MLGVIILFKRLFDFSEKVRAIVGMERSRKLIPSEFGFSGCVAHNLPRGEATINRFLVEWLNNEEDCGHAANNEGHKAAQDGNSDGVYVFIHDFILYCFESDCKSYFLESAQRIANAQSEGMMQR